MLSVVIYIPRHLKIMKNKGFLIGHVDKNEDNISFYVIDKIKNSSELTLMNEKFKIIGFDYADNFTGNAKVKINCLNCITIYHSYEVAWHIEVPDIKIKNSIVLNYLKPIIVYYDYNAFLHSYIDNNSGSFKDNSIKPYDHFMILSELIKLKRNEEDQKRSDKSSSIKILSNVLSQLIILILVNISKLLDYISFIGKYSAFIRNLRESVGGILHIQEKGSKLQQSSLLVTIFTDVVIGIFVLWWVKDIYQPVGPLLDGAEYIVMYLRELLNSLMGSPVGLKLNRAFNTMLGKCFLYHIELWWIFLVQLSPWIFQGFNFLLGLGALGFSFQAAMLCDIVSLTTFHVHCIYVYAAKLYNIQVNGVKSLWRLFLGRKYNPLRDRVDSCSYNNRQLFIGTLGFTIFLFLLPTTTLYYIVFTMLRIFMLLISEILDWIREIVHSIPIYTTILWTLGSSSVPSTAYIALESSLKLVHATARPLSPLQHHWLIPPPIKHIHRMQWHGIFGKILNGELLTQF